MRRDDLMTIDYLMKQLHLEKDLSDWTVLGVGHRYSRKSLLRVHLSLRVCIWEVVDRQVPVVRCHSKECLFEEWVFVLAPWMGGCNKESRPIT